MTNEDLSKQVQNLADAVATLAETMNARFEQIDQRFESIDTQLSDIRKDHKNLTSIVRDMELRFERRFETLEAGQLTIRANITGLRHDIFIEEGSREETDETVFKEQKHNYESLDKRLRLVEAKFPDLAQKVATA